jgi:preprotein translocase SecE subunit
MDKTNVVTSEQKDESGKLIVKSDSSDGKASKSLANLGFFSVIKQFLSDVRQEMRRITWPSRSHVGRASAITLIIVILATAYTAAIDVVAQRVFELMKSSIY